MHSEELVKLVSTKFKDAAVVREGDPFTHLVLGQAERSLTVLRALAQGNLHYSHLCVYLSEP